MTVANISGAVVADGNVLVLAGPAGSFTDLTAVTSTQLKSTGVKDITYDLTTSGLAWATTQDTVNNDRFTLPVSLTQPGMKHYTLTLQYVYGVATGGATADVADALFVEGSDYVIAVRWGVSHDQAIASADKFDIISVRAGHAGKDAPAQNSHLTKTRTFFVSQVPQEDQVLAA